MAQWCCVEGVRLNIATDAQFNGIVVGNGACGGERAIGHDHTRGGWLWDMRRKVAFRDFIIDTAALTTPVQQSPCFVPTSPSCILELHIDVKQTVIFGLNDSSFGLETGLERRDLSCRGLWGPTEKDPGVTLRRGLFPAHVEFR